MVDEVLASCYPSTDRDMAHVVMTPMRWFSGFMEPIFGFDSDGHQAFAVTLECLCKLGIVEYLSPQQAWKWQIVIPWKFGCTFFKTYNLHEWHLGKENFFVKLTIQ